MKKYTKIITGLVSLFMLVGIAYATVTTANSRYSSISKLPWNGSGNYVNGYNNPVYDAAHDVGSAVAGDSSRFVWEVGSSISTTSVVKDNRTGLMWESENRSIDTDPPFGVQKTWDNAKAYCDSLVKGGYSDWKLPEMRELISIVNFSRIDSTANGYGSKFSISPYFYWTATYSGTTAFSYNFSELKTYVYPKGNTYHFLCVR